MIINGYNLRCIYVRLYLRYWSAWWSVPSNLYIWRYSFWFVYMKVQLGELSKARRKLMIEVAPTLWLRPIASNIFGFDNLKSDWDIFKLSSSLEKYYESSPALTMFVGHWTTFYKSRFLLRDGIREVPMVGLIHLNFKCKMGIWQILIRLNALMTCTKK